MITIIDYGVGNIGSVGNTLARLGQDYQVSDKPGVVSTAEALILPGVGAAGVGMKNLVEGGLDKAIGEAISNNIPFFGICLGMQLLFDSSQEGETACLGIFKGTVQKFDDKQKVPQIGWNEVIPAAGNPEAKYLFGGISKGSSFYFVNSFYPVPGDQSIIAATTEYGVRFASIVAKDNIVATQFHPEKSGQVGLLLLRNFIEKIAE